jgi:hypothetical protein
LLFGRRTPARRRGIGKPGEVLFTDLVGAELLPHSPCPYVGLAHLGTRWLPEFELISDCIDTNYDRGWTVCSYRLLFSSVLMHISKLFSKNINFKNLNNFQI